MNWVLRVRSRFRMPSGGVSRCHVVSRFKGKNYSKPVSAQFDGKGYATVRYGRVSPAKYEIEAEVFDDATNSFSISVDENLVDQNQAPWRTVKYSEAAWKMVALRPEQSINLFYAGYDPCTRDAFREWLKAHGAADWAAAEVPSCAIRRTPAPPPRVVEFARFRNREMSSFLVELGAAAKRGSGGETLTFFFYGYTWELGGAKASETGHFDFVWLMNNAHGKIDGFSSPLSYSSRNLTGSTVMMSAAESVMRNGYLWFNEIDHRTHHEEMWDHMTLFTPYSDPNVTREIMMRDSAADILRGYGDWWMDLFGRGWFRDAEIWKVRRALNALDDLLADRKGMYAPQIASVVHEDSFFRGGWDARRSGLRNRKGFATCGADYGQYLLEDILENPPASVKLFYLTIADRLAPDVRVRLDAFKAARPDVTFVENVTPQDITAEAIAARARKAGVHCFAAPGMANICSAEGVILVQALKDGPLEVDFGVAGAVRDALNGGFVCDGPKATLSFRKGETRLFRTSAWLGRGDSRPL